jgi:hypothetical protein
MTFAIDGTGAVPALFPRCRRRWWRRRR